MTDGPSDGAQRDHGGDPVAAIAPPGGAPADRRDLSTGVDPRIFPYSPTWLRLGLPGGAAWARLAAASG